MVPNESEYTHRLSWVRSQFSLFVATNPVWHHDLLELHIESKPTQLIGHIVHRGLCLE
jgi:hypothetical protein